MKNISFRVRNFKEEQFLTFDISNEAELDEELMDFLEDEEPVGIVPVIFEEDEEFDTFSYDITGKIRLSELSNQEINAEMVLLVMRGLVISMIDMAEYRVPMSYLVLNRNYIYIDSDYQVEFVCIPLEDMKEDVDVSHFLRNFLASLRFDPSENGDYVARMITFINNREVFNLHKMLILVENLMERLNIEIPDTESTQIYSEYREVDNESEAEDELELDYAYENDSESVDEFELDSADENDSKSEDLVYENGSTTSQEGQSGDLTHESGSTTTLAEDFENNVESKSARQMEDKLSGVTDSLEEDDSQQDLEEEESKPKDNEPHVGIVLDDDLDEFLAEKEKEDQDDSNVKERRTVKVSRASILKNTQETAEEVSNEEEPEVEEKKEEDSGGNIITQTLDTAASILRGNSGVLKVNPYLIRVNTDERIMITKQNFKIGKGSMSADYIIQGNNAISRVHAIISNKNGAYYIRDNKSVNHTFVDGKRVKENEQELLTQDCRIVLGNEEFVFKLQ